MLVQQNMNGDTPLHVAARSRSREIVSLFIDHARRESQAIRNQRKDDGHNIDIEKGILSKEFQLVRIANNKNNTALHEALQHQTESGIPQLLRSADPGFEYFANDCGETPLFLAVEQGNPYLLEDILKICPSQSYGAPGGRTALHALALRRYFPSQGEISKVVHQLSHIVKEVDKNGRTALHYAVHSNNIKFIHAIMEVDPSVCYMRDKDGMTALHLVAVDDVPWIKETMEIMLRHCPDCWEVLDNEGRNFLHVAAQNRNFAVLEYVLNEISSDLAVDTITGMKDKKGRTSCEVSQGFLEILRSNTRVKQIDWYGIGFMYYERLMNKQVRTSLFTTLKRFLLISI
ncbi:hypothetical protein MKW92_029330 [Papaver armeniacum]|nr:hypothetical protein MKW92_029330 [Papaver armeniacum]